MDDDDEMICCAFSIFGLVRVVGWSGWLVSGMLMVCVILLRLAASVGYKFGMKVKWKCGSFSVFKI